MTVTTGMVGQGFYDHHSAPQWAATEEVLPWLEGMVGEMNLDDPLPAVGIADFGCSEGGNSLRVMQRLVSVLQVHTSRPILTVYSDLPTNDYAGLFRSLCPDSGPLFGKNTYAAVVGGSMFDQLLPPGSMHVATTFNAIGFLSRRPLDRLPGYILPNGPSNVRGIGEVTPEERAVFARQAADDLESFLRARAAEVVPGGRLLVEVFGARNDCRTTDGLYDVLNDAVLEVLDAGLVDRSAYEAYYQPVYARDLAELTAPVDAGGPLAALFRLDRAASYEAPVPFVETFRKTEDVGAYARAYTDFFRAFTEPVLRAAFPSVDPARLAGEVYERAERLVRDHSERYPFRYISVAMLLTRL